MAVSRRLRFEILRRDNFTCQYCGAKAPDVRLTIDHVKPVALGGRDDPSNLVTACEFCNPGKASIAPDSPIVESVRVDALRWAQAIRIAAAERASQRDLVEEACETVQSEWENWHTSDGKRVPMDPSWTISIEQFIGAGLDDITMARMVTVTMCMNKVAVDQKWRYFCGCCWRTIDQLHERAHQIVDEGLDLKIRIPSPDNPRHLDHDSTCSCGCQEVPF